MIAFSKVGQIAIATVEPSYLLQIGETATGHLGAKHAAGFANTMQTCTFQHLQPDDFENPDGNMVLSLRSLSRSLAPLYILQGSR